MFSLIQEAQAETVTWTGEGDGKNWSSPDNWSTHTTPNTGDNITIQNGTVNLDINFALIGSITVDTNGNLIINGGKVLTNTGTITNYCSIISDHNASIINYGIITNKYHECNYIDPEGGNSNVPDIWNSGNFTNLGDIYNYEEIVNLEGGTFNNSGNIVTYAGGGAAIVNDGTLNNSGTITISLGADMNQFGILNNAPSGRILLVLSSTMSLSGPINNFGTIYVSSYSDITGSSYATINNFGSIYNQGTLLNSHRIINNFNGTIYDSHEIINNPGATVTNNGTINEYCDLKFTVDPTSTGKITVNRCLDSTVINVILNPDTVNSGGKTTVIADVTDTSSSTNPTGTVMWTGENGIFGATSCYPDGYNILGCKVSYSAPNRTGFVKLTAIYVPVDFNFTSSYGTSVLSIPAPLPVVTPSPELVNQTSLIVDAASWAGNLTSPVTDEQVLNDVGISGNHIPPWFKKVAKWFVDGQMSRQEFVNSLKYLNEEGIIETVRKQISHDISLADGISNPTISLVKPDKIRIISIGMIPDPLKVGDIPEFTLTFQNISQYPFSQIEGCTPAKLLHFDISPPSRVQEFPGGRGPLCAVRWHEVGPGETYTAYGQSAHLNGYYKILESGKLNVTLNLYAIDPLHSNEFLLGTVQFDVNATQ